MSKGDENTIQADVAENVSPHNRALYEAGKALIVESVSVGRDFCKFMTTTALSAIPVYLALLKLVLPKDYVLQSRDEALFLLPPVAFLLSAVIFILGYFPQRGLLSLDLPAEIERERDKTIRRRQGYSLAAFIVFTVGVLFAVWQVIGAMGAGQQASPH